MAGLVLTNPSVTVNSVDLSSQVTSVTISESYDTVDATAFGATMRTNLVGLGEASISLTFLQSFAASETYATIEGLVGSTTTVVVKPDAGATSATNPSMTMTCVVSEWEWLGGGIGELSTVDVTWPINGSITRATS